MKKLIVPFLVLIAGMVACSTVPFSGRSRIDLVPNEAILASSFSSYAEFMSQAPVSKNAAATRQVREIGERIAKATDTYLRAIGLSSEASKYRWEFNLIASDQVNAFCMPGGKIVVYEGILPIARTDDQLATVVSHEVAHAVAKHANERISQQVAKQYGGQALSIALSGKSQVLQQVTSVVYGVGTDVLVTLPYSRLHEHEADLIGLYLMALAGYDYHQAADFWVRMSGGRKESSDFLSTHPSDSKRIAAIQAEIPKVDAFMQDVREGKSAPAPTPANTSSYLDPAINKGRKVPLKIHY
ncbi:MAG: M48 family metallopeptidase [Porphyromonas sp.]|nr:M48 family metallopeptidase [Porphyromonas sp.]